jgi:antitoxin YefM
MGSLRRNEIARSRGCLALGFAGATLASAMDRVCDDHEPLIVTRNGAQSVVMLSLEDYQALEETAALLRSPANAKRLLAAVAQLKAGKGNERDLAP